MDRDEAWALMKCCPDYWHFPEDTPEHWINMNDVWCWACSDGLELTDENVVEVATLYNLYGFCGLLYYQAKTEGIDRSEFEDNTRFLEFVRAEEAIRAEVPDSNKRAYHKASYTLGSK